MAIIKAVMIYESRVMLGTSGVKGDGVKDWEVVREASFDTVNVFYSLDNRYDVVESGDVLVW